VLWAGRFGPEKAAEILAYAVSRMNSVSDQDKGVALIGNAIAKFFSTAEIAHLDGAKTIFSVTLRHL
jgi:hypothetical protein